MSYNKIRDEKGISQKRSKLSSASDVLHSFELTAFEEGANLSGGAIIVNMHHDGSALQTRRNVRTIDMGADISNGEPDAYCFEEGKYVFKKGTSLFMYDVASEECYKEMGDLPEGEHCVIYHLDGCFAVIFEGGGVYTVSDDFSHTTTAGIIYIPMLYRLYSTKQEFVEGINFLTECFRVYINLGMGESCELPATVLVDEDFCEVRNSSGVELGSDAIGLTVHEDGGATIVNRTIHSNLTVKLRLKQDETGVFTAYDDVQKYKKMFFYPLGTLVFSSVTGRKINLLTYGGEFERNFAVFCVDKNIYAAQNDTLVFENTEKITSVLRYSEEYLLFSPHYIRKMALVETEGADMRFTATVENFKYDVGCDMPKSAVCTDDKIIYANSKAGVFYLDRFGFSQRDMSRNVSANVERGEQGFLACEEESLENAEAVICGGKYYLRVDDVFYVWDFRYAVPSSSTEKLSESRKMRWTLCSGISCNRIVGADVNEFYFITKDGEFACLSCGTSLETADAESIYKSEEYSLSPFGRAVVFKLSLSLGAAENCTVRCYFDGEQSSAKHILSPKEGNLALYKIRPEKRKCRKFSFSVSSFGAIRIEGARLEWY